VTGRCTCRPACLAPVYASDQVTDDGALISHAATALQPVAPPAPPVSPLSRPRLRGAGSGFPRRL
jgi:hypothetical protein